MSSSFLATNFARLAVMFCFRRLSQPSPKIARDARIPSSDRRTGASQKLTDVNPRLSELTFFQKKLRFVGFPLARVFLEPTGWHANQFTQVAHTQFDARLVCVLLTLLARKTLIMLAPYRRRLFLLRSFVKVILIWLELPNSVIDNGDKACCLHFVTLE